MSQQVETVRDNPFWQKAINEVPNTSLKKETVDPKSKLNQIKNTFTGVNLQIAKALIEAKLATKKDLKEIATYKFSTETSPETVLKKETELAKSLAQYIPNKELLNEFNEATKDYVHFLTQENISIQDINRVTADYRSLITENLQNINNSELLKPKPVPEGIGNILAAAQ